MSSVVMNSGERKGIFPRNKVPTSPTTLTPSPSRPTSRAISPVKPSTSSPRAEKVKKIKRKTSDSKLLAERASRCHIPRHSEQSKDSSDVATSKKDEDSTNPEERHYEEKDTESIKTTIEIESTLKKTNQMENITMINDLSSPFKKVAELIDNLNLSLDNISGKSSNKDKNIYDSSKIGDFLSARGSTESVTSNDSDFSLALESPLPCDPKQRLIKQINYAVKEKMTNDNDAQDILIPLLQLSELIANTEQQNKRRMKNMQESLDNSFGELFMEKNDQITQLQLSIEGMKRENSKEIEKVKSCEDLMATKNEVARLKEIISMRSTEINQLTYKLIDAQSYIESLEKEKYAQIKINTDDAEDIQHHFKTIKKALLSNRTLLKMIQTKQVQNKIQA